MTTTTYSPQAINLANFEIGVQFHLPTDDLHWIPNGFETVTLVVDRQDLEDDKYDTLSCAAEAWCDSKGYSFFQLIEEP
jgi:hypothetical protein